MSDDVIVGRVAEDLAARVPKAWNMDEIKMKLPARPDPEALKTVLLQELDRYNGLLIAVNQSLHDLQLGLLGQVVITPELESVFEGLLTGTVPKAWSFCYPSLKSLGNWMRDLQGREAAMGGWAKKEMPKVFWLGAFTYPTGFLTALLQTSARKNGVSIDTLSWEYPVLNQDEGVITQHAKEGAYMRDIYLEGARWDFEASCLAEPRPMELVSPMPIVHFKPVDSKKKASKGFYTCPLYLYPIRTGTRERPSYMVSVEVKSGSVDTDFWTKRGTAMLLSLAS